MIPEWKKRLHQLREQYLKEKFPATANDHGVPLPKPYKDNTANGLQRCIRDFLVYSGHDCQRHNVQGQLRKIKGVMKYTKSSSRKGSADQFAIIAGRHISIETKIGKDTVKEEQHAEKQRIERAGGIYIIARNMENFLSWYDQVLPALTKN